jgi:hypothetical protein
MGFNWDEILRHEWMLTMKREKERQAKEYNLGKLVKDLEKYKDESIPVEFDDGTIPENFRSWRGSYDYLALGYKNKEDMGNRYMTSKAFYEEAKSKIGKTFEGYKGGIFTMDENTPLYQANWGESGVDRGEEYKIVKIIGIEESDNKIYIITRDTDD